MLLMFVKNCLIQFIMDFYTIIVGLNFISQFRVLCPRSQILGPRSQFVNMPYLFGIINHQIHKQISFKIIVENIFKRLNCFSFLFESMPSRNLISTDNQQVYIQIDVGFTSCYIKLILWHLTKCIIASVLSLSTYFCLASKL